MLKAPFNPSIAGRSVKTLFAATAMLFAASTMIAVTPQAKEQWASPHYREHALVGTIWSADFKPVTPDALEAAILKAKYVLLGETHNNIDHHRLQAEMVETLIRSGRRPAIVMEMVPTSLQGALDRHLKTDPKNAKKLGKVLKWEARGWPKWSMYQPIAEAALSADLPLLGGALDRKTTRAISKSDPSQAKLILDLGLHQPVKPQIVKALGKEIHEGHCNMLPESAIKPMLMVQRAKDGQLAKTMLNAKPEDGAILIAGSGHVRKDWAVPSFIKQELPDSSTVSIAFLQVDPESQTPSDYVEKIAGLAEPYDFIYFTPKADLIDRCAEMAEHMKKMKPRK